MINMEYVTSIRQMLQSSAEFSRNRKTLNTCKTSVQSVKVNYAGINQSLKRIAQEIETECQLMGQMALVLEDSTLSYQKYEEQIAKLECKSISQTSADQKKSDEEKDSDNGFFKGTLFDYIATWSNGWKLVGNVGAVGGVISGIGSLVTRDGSAKDYITALKYFVSAAGNGAVAIGKGGAEGFRYATGMNDALAKIQPGTFGKGVKSSIASQIDDLNFAKADGAAGKFKTATKWAGHILTVASNGVENYEEYKKGDISAGRAMGETVVESAVDIAVGIGATAVVTAGLSALGVVAAPAVLVGAGAAAITIGANAVCEWATGGKNLGEVAADFVCDVGEGAINLAKKAKNKIKETFTAPWKGFCGAFA